MIKAFHFCAAALLGLAMAGSANADTTIILSGTGNAQNLAYYEKLAADYSAQSNGITVKFVAGPREAGDFQQQLLRDGMVGAKLPDVIMFTGPLLQVLAERNIVVPLDELIGDQAAWQQSFSSAVTAPGVIGDKTFGLTYGVSMPVVVFNSELVSKAGTDPKHLPNDWPGILNLAKKIKETSRGTVGGFFEYDNGIGFSWLVLLNSFGGTVMNADDTAFAFQGSEGLRALELLRDFGSDAGQTSADMTRDQARQAFGAGGIGVFASMSSLIPAYEKGAADKFNVVSVPFPLAENGKVPVSAVIGAMTTRDPETMRAAFDFMKFAAGASAQLTLATTTGYAPANLVAIDGSSELKSILAERANARSYLENLDAVTGWYLVPGENGLRIADMFIDRLQRVVTLKETPEAALAAMQADAQTMFKH